LNDYEILFITDPSLDEERLTGILDRIRNHATANSGTVESVDDWGVRRLAYTIKRLNEGRYTLVNFKCDPEAINPLDKQLRVLQEVIRFVIIRKGE